MILQKKNKQKIRLGKFIVDSLIILGVTFLIILVIEGFLRLFFPQNLVGTSIIGKTFLNSDAILGMRYTPRSKWRFVHPEYSVEYEINEHGFRDKKEHLVPKPEGAIRVLLIGDSFTFGQSVNYDQTWPVIVEKRLGQSGMNHIELVKAGIQGMDTRSEYILIKELLDKCQCDAVVVGFLINDLYTNTIYGIGYEDEKSTTNNDDGKITKTKSASEESWLGTAKRVFIRHDRNATLHLLTLAKRFAIANDYIYCKLYLLSLDKRQWFTTPLPPIPRKKLKITKLLFEKMADYCHSLGKKLIVFSIPQQFQVLYYEQSRKFHNIPVTLYDHYFSEIAKQNGFAWITTLNEFNNYNSNKDELFFRLDGHLTVAGSQIVAKVFWQEIIPMLNEKH
jgi:hypothetical protein